MKCKLESGKSYSLKELLSGSRKIIIPDLQRDYCWGGSEKKESNELVSGFFDSLFEAFCDIEQEIDLEKREIQLGMLYAYENPIDFIQLCDGQQRITTLFLLIGLLNQKLKNTTNINKYLIPKSELKEYDLDPYLQYSIRESTLFFWVILQASFFYKKTKK